MEQQTESPTPRHIDEDGEAWYTTQGAADLIGVSDQTIRRWCQDGSLRHRRPGTQHLIPLSAIDERRQEGGAGSR